MSSDEKCVIRFTNRTIDINDVDEIFDETEERITIAGYIDGESKVITLTGDDARAMKAWLDADHERWVAYEESKGNTVADRKRPLHNAERYAHVPVLEDEQDIPF
jgi:hypothetical protein